MNSKAMFTAARLSEKAGRKAWAASLYGRSAEGAGNKQADALFRLANLAFHQGELDQSREFLEEAIALKPGQAPWHYRLATVWERLHDKDAALAHYRKANALAPDNKAWADKMHRCEQALIFTKAQLHDERAKSLRQKGQRWQELELLQSAKPSFESSPDWFLRLADALEAMNRYGEAAEAFQRANELRPGTAVNLFREGHCWLRAGSQDKAASAFKRAKKADQKLQSKSLGIGVFYEQRGMWPEAADRYAIDCEDSPWNGELHFRAGRANERCYRWNAAVAHYEEAISSQPALWRNHFRLGFVKERLGDFPAAEKSYAYGLDCSAVNNEPARYWAYRLGVVKEAQGDFEGALAAYSTSLDYVPAVANAENEPALTTFSQDTAYEMQILQRARSAALRSRDADQIQKIAAEFENRELWADALACLNAAADRKQSFDASIYFRIAKAYQALNQPEAAAKAYRMTRISVSPRGIDNEKYKKDAGLQRNFQYSEMSQHLPIRKNVILYESFFGKQITCNPYALFREIYNDQDYAHFLHVWVTTPDTAIPKWMRHRENILFVQRGSHLYLRFLATAKYLVNNVTFQAMFSRRQGQRYLNTWHGTPMKTLGKDIQTGVVEHRNVTRNFLHATHIITPNEHTRRVLLERYDVEGLGTAKVAITGYPRIDFTLNASPNRVEDLREALGLVDRSKKVVLYAPTWRGSSSEQHFDSERLVSDLQALAGLDCAVLFQGHHLSASFIPDSLPVHVVNEEINTNELLSVVDILITDYSSIVFDFLPTQKPVICYTYDLDAYKAERGLYFSPSDIGIYEARSQTALVEAVRRSLAGDGPETVPSNSLIEEYCGHEDGRASARTKKFFLEDETECLITSKIPNKRRFLFHHSMLPNGITSSLINLLNSLDPAENDVTVVVPVEGVDHTKAGLSRIAALPNYVRLVADGGRQVANIEEKWLIDCFNRWNVFASEEHRRHYVESFAKEYKRLFGDSHFDVVVEFEGYSRYWTSVLAAAPAATKKVIYLHNEMEAEWQIRFPYLRGVFELYDEFDALASVSPALSELNQAALTRIVNVEVDKFLPVINQIDIQGTLARAAEPLDEDLVEWFEYDTPTFVTMGRLSKEKDQAKLLHALARVIKEGHQARLLVLGEGPLRADLEELRAELNLDRAVYFAGLRENPFPALSASDCFVLPSNHEGQPMVLLEAMILGKEILATDIPGSRQVLSDNLECLCQNSVDGLADGIKKVLQSDRQHVPDFDVERYAKEALEAFLGAAGTTP
ncbi:CDP-glycerol glycerophosphotransferase family protein [Arthrobacter sp. Sa2CUA1]|uniref:CDP-glycerol glycerophosphotransferase family protein n=1 Tax=Arthrobacter gallicola TaxID=2762225 RepID=A0ABR8UQI1_9MICC|nr:CDP-glycerol glycerophosphotransferase family protein [Arthrobacter gallicola]MBD7994476.1 CDP-glycerol glycerophosphotransferase family protein [Arthrobacter gallicola]